MIIKRLRERSNNLQHTWFNLKPRVNPLVADFMQRNVLNVTIAIQKNANKFKHSTGLGNDPHKHGSSYLFHLCLQNSHPLVCNYPYARVCECMEWCKRCWQKYRLIIPMLEGTVMPTWSFTKSNVFIVRYRSNIASSGQIDATPLHTPGIRYLRFAAFAFETWSGVLQWTYNWKWLFTQHRFADER